EAQVGGGRGDDLLAAVVAVLTELGDQDAGPAPLALQELLNPLPDLGDSSGAVAEAARVDSGHLVDLGLVPAEDLLQGVADLAQGRPGPRRGDGQLQQVPLARTGALGQGRQRRVDGGWVALGPQLGEALDLRLADGPVVDLEHLYRVLALQDVL